MDQQFSILGQTVREPTRKLETFPAPEKISAVKLICHEVTSRCPITGQPDFSTVEIEYVPKGLCVESKSLKLYIWSFREEGLFGEAMASRFARDLYEALEPEYVTVTVKMASRGGIVIEPTATIDSFEGTHAGDQF